ncbi:MAG: M1 family aminopeptidase, partial [Bacteroidota bacterium]
SGEIPSSGSFFQGINNAYDSQWDQSVTYTLSEPYNAYQWFAAKQVLTDKADSVRVHVTTPSHLQVASNGIRQEPEIIDEARVTHKWESHYPIAYYLISMTIGEYQEYNFTVEPEGEEPIFVQNFIYDNPGALDFYKVDMDQTVEMMELFSELFGAYPFSGEKYGHVLAPFGGGMEHQTMSLMGNFNFTLIAHELGHQWFGDYVTCGTWQDIWINEGFARYSEYLAIEKLFNRGTAEEWRQDDLDRILSETGGSVYVPESGANSPSRIFDFRLTYSKGGQLVHMLRHEINDDEVFFEVLQALASRQAFATSTGDEFVDILNEVTGQDFTWFFDQWYYGGGHPVYDITWQDGSDTVWIQADQVGSFVGAPFFQGTLPFRLTLEDGSEEVVRVFQSENHQQFAIPVSNRVTDVEFDEENWILKEVNSVRRGGVVGIPIEYRASAKLYPQPATGGYAHLEGISKLSRIQVIDLQGRVHSVSTTQEGDHWRIDLSQLQAGLYQLRVEDELGGVTLPLVVR